MSDELSNRQKDILIREISIGEHNSIEDLVKSTDVGIPAEDVQKFIDKDHELSTIINTQIDKRIVSAGDKARKMLLKVIEHEYDMENTFGVGCQIKSSEVLIKQEDNYLARRSNTDKLKQEIKDNQRVIKELQSKLSYLEGKSNNGGSCILPFYYIPDNSKESFLEFAKSSARALEEKILKLKKEFDEQNNMTTKG